MERVAVLHQKFTAAHDAEARTDFIAELGLNLVQVNRQLAVALYVTAHDIGNDFLVCWADDKFALMTILEAQQFRSILLPTARLLPEFGRLHGRHQQFQCARIIHLLANDVFNLAQNAQAERHPGVNARGGALDEPGTQHQFLADNFGVSRGFFQCGEKELRSAHGMLLNSLLKHDFTRRPRFARSLAL